MKDAMGEGLKVALGEVENTMLLWDTRCSNPRPDGGVMSFAGVAMCTTILPWIGGVGVVQLREGEGRVKKHSRCCTGASGRVAGAGSRFMYKKGTDRQSVHAVQHSTYEQCSTRCYSEKDGAWVT